MVFGLTTLCPLLFPDKNIANPLRYEHTDSSGNICTLSLSGEHVSCFTKSQIESVLPRFDQYSQPIDIGQAAVCRDKYRRL